MSTYQTDRGIFFSNICAALNFTGREIARELGVKETQFWGWKTKGVPKKHIALLCDEFSVNREYLETGEGDMFSRPVNESPAGQRILTQRKRDTKNSRNILSPILTKFEDFSMIPKFLSALTVEQLLLADSILVEVMSKDGTNSIGGSREDTTDR